VNAIIVPHAENHFTEVRNIVEPVKNQWPTNWMALSDFFAKKRPLTLHLTDAYRAADDSDRLHFDMNMLIFNK
jgi:hypothetical protein